MGVRGEIGWRSSIPVSSPSEGTPKRTKRPMHVPKSKRPLSVSSCSLLCISWFLKPPIYTCAYGHMIIRYISGHASFFPRRQLCPLQFCTTNYTDKQRFSIFSRYHPPDHMVHSSSFSFPPRTTKPLEFQSEQAFLDPLSIYIHSGALCLAATLPHSTTICLVPSFPRSSLS